MLLFLSPYIHTVYYSFYGNLMSQDTWVPVVLKGKVFWFFLLFFFLLCCQIVPPHKLGRTAIKAEEKKGKQKKPAGNCHCCWQEGGKGTGKDASRKFKRLFP